MKSIFKEAARVRAGSLRQLLGLLIFPLTPWHNSHTPLSATLSLTSPKESCLLVFRLLARHYFTNVCINFLYHYCVTQQTWNVYDVSIVCVRVVHSILWDSMWFDGNCGQVCKLIIFASKLGTSKMFLQSNAQSLQILLIPIT